MRYVGSDPKASLTRLALGSIGRFYNRGIKAPVGLEAKGRGWKKARSPVSLKDVIAFKHEKGDPGGCRDPQQHACRHRHEQAAEKKSTLWRVVRLRGQREVVREIQRPGRDRNRNRQ